MSINDFIGGVQGNINENYSHEELQSMMNYPDISPCDFDHTWEAWLYRITTVWGQVNIKYNDPENGSRNKSVSHQEFLDSIGNEEDLKLFGPWAVDSLAVNKLKVSRNYLAFDGKRYTRSFDIEVKLKDNLQKALDKAKTKGIFGWFISKFK